MSSPSKRITDLPGEAGRAFPTRASRPSLARRLLVYARFKDIALMQGAPLLGAAFAVRDVRSPDAARLAVLAGASCLLVAYVFLLNDWAGIRVDLNDPHRRPRWTGAESVSRREMGVLAVAYLVLSLAAFAVLSWLTLAIAASIAVLGFLYSAPAPAAKGVPLLSSAVHLVGGSLHFLLGYSAFSSIDSRGLLIAAFFGLTLVAGHLNHEARDHEGDSLNRIRTNAVSFGRERVFLASTVVFSVAYGYIVALAAMGVVPRALLFVAVLFLPVQLYGSARTLRRGLTFQSISRFQRLYRVLFAAIGLLMVAALFLER